VTASPPGPSPLRPEFIEGPIVTAADFALESDYLSEALDRHLISGHRAGVVTGLQIQSVGEATVRVTSGTAVDASGRVLLVADAQVLAVPEPAHRDYLEIRLRHARSLQANANPHQLDHWVDNAEVFHQPRAAAGATPDTATGDSGEPSILLAVLAPDGSLHVTERQESSAVGGAVVDPAGRSTSMSLGAGHFRVQIGLAAIPAMTCDATGVTLTGDVRAANGALAMQQLRFNSAQTPPTASPGAIYRTVVESATTPGGVPQTSEELRVQVPAKHPASLADQRVMSIASTGPTDRFERSLSVQADGTVLISGNLTVQGRLVTGPVPADPADPQFRQLLVQDWLNSATSAQAAVAEAYSGRLVLAGLQLVDQGAGGLLVKVTVSNAGAVNLTAVQVTAYLSSRQGRGMNQVRLADLADLAVSDSRSVSATTRSLPSGVTDVVVHAEGRGKTKSTVSAAALNGSITLGA
jgi:hypothetical protein